MHSKVFDKLFCRFERRKRIDHQWNQWKPRIFQCSGSRRTRIYLRDECRFNDRMRKAAALAGTVGSVLFGGVLIILTLIEYDFMRGLGWEPLGLSNTDWPSGLALGPHGYLMTAAFLINGLFVIFFAVGLRQALPFMRTSRVASILLLLAGVAMMGLASTTDPTIRTTPATLHGRIHDGCFVALGTTLFPSMLLFGW